MHLTTLRTGIATVLFFFSYFISAGVLAKDGFELAGITTQAGEKKSFMATREDIALPVTVINGKKEGPVLLLAAGTHGDEFPSMFALQKLREEVRPGELSGTLVLLHLSNIDGFHANRIALNPKDNKNLNREFPGSAGGTPTEQIADFLTKEFVVKADYFIDMHSGSANQQLLDHVYSPFVGNKVLDDLTFEFAKATGMQHIVMYGDRPRDPDNSISFPNTAMTRGVPGLTTEIGHLGQYTEESVGYAVQVSRNALYFLEMLPGEPGPHAEPVIYETLTSAKSHHTGFFLPGVKIGAKVEKGTPLGKVTDYFGNVVETISSPVAGTVMMINEMPAIKEGQSAVTIGILQ